ncbi:hypothetical protein [Carboxylicivirga sp. N1Y90]|uniref:hypothetical protein n=1 Tax=Carboxylicivirga fragile TaxID=3417571 RepID=UPI003D327BFC|nr:hypothetical protein [Marinilabiliaceae bacterium N1Y90]
MYQRDFILRIIEQIAKMIAALLGLLKEDKLDIAYDMLTDGCDKVLGVSYTEFLEMDFEGLKDAFEEKTLSADYWDTLGRYFLVAGELCLGMKKDDEAVQNLSFAQGCFDEAASNYQTYSFNRQVDLEKLNQLKIRLGLINSDK